MSNTVHLPIVGNVDIAEEIDSGYRLPFMEHKKRVTKNRGTLSKIMNYLKFFGKFELSLRDYDKSAEFQHPEVFLGLVNFFWLLDSSVNAHLRSATAFNGTVKTIQNELLDSILRVCKDLIRDEFKNPEYLAFVSDETTDVFCKTQQVIVLPYLVNANPLKIFGDFFI